jgi:hypothetical protein
LQFTSIASFKTLKFKTAARWRRGVHSTDEDNTTR